jgi:arginyl-tRNA--protein-N-Asp/Glu arginylyltransferase
MTQFNIKNNNLIEKNYQIGLLPQRNKKNIYYLESSSRSNLSDFKLSSENRRILNKTIDFQYEVIPLKDFDFNLETQKKIYSWIKKLGWNFPVSSLKAIFTNHIFNYIYVWKLKNEIVAYSVCFFNKDISHIAYVFYNPELNHNNLPIRLVLQTIIDSDQKKLEYCYLGRFSADTGYYKRKMPGFEYFQNNQWLKITK